MMSSIKFEVPGDPIAKGSMTGMLSPVKEVELIQLARDVLATKGYKERWAIVKQVLRVRVFDQKSNKLKPFEDAVTLLARREMNGGDPWTGGVDVSVAFYFERPNCHFRTGRFAHQLKPSTNPDHVATPDLDKLCRSVLDGMTKVVYIDDKQVCKLSLEKCYCTKAIKNPCTKVVVSRRVHRQEDRTLFDMDAAAPVDFPF